MNLCATKRNAMFYLSQSNDTFIYGTVLAVDDLYVALYLISPNGVYDGTLVTEIERIVRVEVGGQYDEKMNILCSGNTLPIWEFSWNDGIVNSMLNASLKTRAVVSIELLKSGYNDVIGIIQKVSNKQVKLIRIDEYGKEDGEVYFKINAITQIIYMSEEEQTIHKLWNTRNYH